jgi:predicted DNA-binding transcriptional regulator AlpA
MTHEHEHAERKHPKRREVAKDLQHVDRLISETETARLLNVSPPTVRRMAERGEGPPRVYPSLRRVAYVLSDVEKFIEQLRASAQSARPDASVRGPPRALNP